MREIYEKIWKKALSYQDKRDDEGHARTVTDFSLELLETEFANEYVVVPAAILHDTGYSQLSKEERFLIFDLNLSKEKKLEIRYKHQKEGVKLAKKILKDLGYYWRRIEKIEIIISEHDTRKGSLSKEESIVRDADKLWRFSNTGFWADVRRMEISPKDLYEKLKRQIDEEGFFFTESAKKIARKELGLRRKEF